MEEVTVRLTSMLGVLTLIVLSGLLLDYFRVLKQRWRPGLCLAVAGLLAGGALTLSAVLPHNQVFGRVVAEGPADAKVVALTFDDGPHPPYTGALLAVLREANVKATFFLIGENAAKHPEWVRAIADAGHQLGNHTYHHVDLLKLNREQVAAEVDKTTAVIAAAAGVTPQVMRPPHGFRDPLVLDVMRERNLQVVEWSVMSRDWTNPGTDTIVERTVSQVKNGSIILLHDGDGIANAAPRAQTIEATRRIIAELQARGYRFVTVEEIIRKGDNNS